MSKFGSALAEAAYLADLDAGGGFDTFGTVQDVGYNAVVAVHADDLDDPELANRLVAEVPETALPGGVLVWYREDSQGFVDVIEYGHDNGTRSGIDAVSQAFDTALREWDDEDILI